MLGYDLVQSRVFNLQASICVQDGVYVWMHVGWYICVDACVWRQEINISYLLYHAHISS